MPTRSTNTMPSPQRTHPRRALLIVAAIGSGVALFGCEEKQPPPSPSAPTPAPQPVETPLPAAEPSPPPITDTRPLPERLGEAIAQAAPLSEIASTDSHAQAAQRLGSLRILLDTADENVLWGHFDPELGYDPAENIVTFLTPLVWAKAYLSCFAFPGTFEVRREGDFDIIELSASLRTNLPAGQYPYPLWFSEKEWNAYAQTQSLILVLSHNLLVAAYYRADNAASASPVPPPRPWDKLWRWQDPKQGEQPGVSQFSAIFSPDNPHTTALETSFRQLDAALFSHRCVSCHAPDNRSNQSALSLLSHPAQALAMRHSLLSVLMDNSMPPEDVARGIPSGINDEAQRQRYIKLAEEFEALAQRALDFETKRR